MVQDRNDPYLPRTRLHGTVINIQAQIDHRLIHAAWPVSNMVSEYPVMILVGIVVSRLAIDSDARSKGAAVFCIMSTAIAMRENIVEG